MKRSHSTVNGWLVVAALALATGPATADDVLENLHDADRARFEEALRGLVWPSRTVQIGAPLDGEIAEVFVKDNDRVKADAPLAKMKDELQTNQLDAVKLQVELAQAELEGALEELNKAKGAGSAVSKLELRRAELAHKVAEIQVRRAEQAVTQEEAKLNRFTIRAPFAGRVIGLQSDAGAAIRIAEPIITLVKLDELEAKLSAPVELYGKLEAGKAYVFEAGHPVNRRITAKLKTAEPIIDSASKSFRATFTIANADEKLPSGFAVRFVWPQPTQ